ncbi:MAG: patatin-like phospholipase family protein [Caldilineaceae bacterium]|nr:patatin-like phospholipase family protein [Caldilineaceae bacterium]MBP8109044.1 patatin-like phospholipase family protein [Caldilineaceae bacterium]MBP8122027.1 patatin-like phospholipase family protein [Caldilineaceae bacterium]MBP9074182.1 patatin-like phospholipase family protein [Caldilineaceae bacterium]
MKIGLALGGGGARGAAHFGVLKELARLGIRPDLITGTSVGGLVGAMVAAGHSMDQMTAFFQKLSLTAIYALPNSVPAFSSNTKVERMLEELFGRITFADLQIPLAVVTTDLVSRREVILDEGDLVSAIMATTSLPVLLPPVLRDGCALVDGGVLNNTPFDVARARGATFVIAVDLSNTSPYEIDPEPRSGGYGLLDALPIPHTRRTWQVISAINDIISSTSLNTRLALHPPDIFLQPQMGHVGIFDSTQWQECMTAGQDAVVEAEDQFIKLRARIEKSAPALHA